MFRSAPSTTNLGGESVTAESHYTCMKTARYASAKTRSWAKAGELVRREMDAGDPVKIALREIEDRERLKWKPIGTLHKLS